MRKYGLYTILGILGAVVPIELMQFSPIVIFMTMIWLLPVAYFLFQYKIANVLVYLSFSLLFGIFNYIGSIHFIFLPQVLTILTENPISLILQGHFWGPRYLVVYPSVWLSDFFQLELNIAFTIYCIILLLILVKLICRIGKLIHGDFTSITFIYGLGSTFMVFVLSFLMNGRLIAAFTGIALILYHQTKLVVEDRGPKLVDYVWMFVGVFFSMVSSGTMMVAIFQVIIGTYVVLKVNRRSTIGLVSFLVIGILGIGSYVVKMVMKNIAFYGEGLNGVIQMLAHGMGQIFFHLNPWLMLAGLVPTIITVLIVVLKYKNLKSSRSGLITVYLSLPLSIINGMFGFSTAMMIIPGLIIYTCYISVHYFEKNYHSIGVKYHA